MRRTIPLLLALWVAAPVTAQPLTPAIAPSTISGPSPLAVFLDATGTQHANATLDAWRLHDLSYFWDFDDPDAGAWRTTSRSRNHMTGPLAVHVFEPSAYPDCGGTCKVYTVTLEVEDPLGASAQASQTITVHDPDQAVNGWGAPGLSLCVSRTGNSAGCPPGAQTLTSSDSFDSIAGTQIAAGYRRILFRRGETWAATGTVDLNAGGPGLIGAYGAGAVPVIDASGSSFSLFSLRANDWRIQDLEFRGPSSGGIVFDNWGSQARDILLQRTDTSPGTWDMTIRFDPGTLPFGTPESATHQNLFVVDNVWGDHAPTANGYHFFGQAVGLFFLGNQLGVPGSHNLRPMMSQKILISNNAIGPQRPTRGVISIRTISVGKSGCPSADALPYCGDPTDHIVIQDNDLWCQGASCVGAVGDTSGEGGGPGGGDLLFERNLIRKRPGDQKTTWATEFKDIARLTVRNNILDVTGWTWVGGFGMAPGGRIYNNTCYRADGNSTALFCMQANGAAECANNALYAPLHSGSKAIFDPVGAPCADARNNVSDASGGGITGNPFVSAAPQSRSEFTPALSSALLDAGDPDVPVPDDGIGACREGALDIGAMERDAGSCPAFSGGTELAAPTRPILIP